MSVAQQARRDRIVHSALELLGEREYERIQMRDVAERADAARDDRDLVDHVAPGQRERDQRVPHLVVRDDAPLERVEQPVLLLQARHDALDRAVEVLERHRLAAAARREQRRFVDDVGKVGPGKARCFLGNHFQVHGFRQGAGLGARLGDAGSGDDQRDSSRLFVVGVLAPHAVVAQMPAVVAPENDDRVLGEAVGVQRVEHTAALRIHVTDGRVVAADQVARR